MPLPTTRRRRPPGVRPAPTAASLVLALALVAALAACGEPEAEAAPPEAPEVGLCRVLDADDVAQASNDTAPVPCSEEHTAETFEVGELPEDLHDLDQDDPRLGAWVYRTCSRSFRAFLGADDSSVMRTVLSWAWFRPDAAGWEAGARWYRCDVVGGGEQMPAYRPLPETTAGLLEGMPPDEWMVCATGDDVARSTKVPCSEPHTWRAVTTIKVGEADEPYPGDRVVEVTTREFCSESVGAWLGYPLTYDYRYTMFGETEWEVGNRRSVCWARTQA